MTALFPELLRREPQGDATTDEWYSPKWLVQSLPPVWLDPCHDPRSNVRPAHALTIADDGLATPWASVEPSLCKVAICFANPPYSNGAAWVAKCRRESWVLPLPVVALVKAWVGEPYWAANVWGRARWVMLLFGRIRFDTPEGPATDSASFNSALICWSQDEAKAMCALATIRQGLRAVGKPHRVIDARADFGLDNPYSPV